MLTMEDYAGKRGPFRDERGRFRRRNWDEMGLLGQATARLAEAIAKRQMEDNAFFSGLMWDGCARTVPTSLRVRLPGDNA